LYVNAIIYLFLPLIGPLKSGLNLSGSVRIKKDDSYIQLKTNEEYNVLVTLNLIDNVIIRLTSEEINKISLLIYPASVPIYPASVPIYPASVPIYPASVPIYPVI
jgi:hypothetical protein